MIEFGSDPFSRKIEWSKLIGSLEVFYKCSNGFLGNKIDEGNKNFIDDLFKG